MRFAGVVPTPAGSEEDSGADRGGLRVTVDLPSAAAESGALPNDVLAQQH
ncbi:hypothetical protein DFR68_102210 [Nocardia mexicana]|uniref:Uncharacterized protein n=1 Tax=Nocardia mexicana TaxID=279262 RepID=A0A370HBK8_9NOCA|nr:hypothetical protein DFR68_102210 [Nocardia mexicana]